LFKEEQKIDLNHQQSQNDTWQWLHQHLSLTLFKENVANLFFWPMWNSDLTHLQMSTFMDHMPAICPLSFLVVKWM